MKNLFLSLLFCLGFSHVLFAQSYQWGIPLTNAIFNQSVDKNGNVIIVNPPSISKYDALGNNILNIGLLLNNMLTAVDTFGNIYVVGSNSQNSVDVDPSPSVFNLPFGTLLIKYSPTGNLIWGKRINTSIGILDLKIAKGGSIYFLWTCGGCSYFNLAKFDTNGNQIWQENSNAGFNNGLNISFNKFTLDNNENIISVAGSIIAKWDSSNNRQWTYQINSNDITFSAIETDNQNNIYIGSYRNGCCSNATFDFDFFPATSNATGIIFLAKYNSNAEFQWVKGFSGTNYVNNFNFDNSICVDANNNVYIAGVLRDSLNFNSSGIGAGLNSPNDNSPFIACYNATGNFRFVFMLQNTQGARGLSVNANGNNLYLSGDMSNTGIIDLDPSNNNAFLNANGNNGFLAKYTITGNNNGNVIIWNGTGNWSTNTANWSINAVPQATDSAIVQTGTVTINNNQTINTLVLQNNANIIVDGANAVLNINGNFYDKGGNINATNGGTIIYNGNAYNANNKRITNSSSFKVKGGISIP